MILLSYNDVLDVRGDPLRRALDIVANLIKDIDDSIKYSKLLIYLTHINEEAKQAEKNVKARIANVKASTK